MPATRVIDPTVRRAELWRLYLERKAVIRMLREKVNPKVTDAAPRRLR